jgi:hypothetical protein
MSDSAFNPETGGGETVDSTASVQISEDRMSAYLTINAPVGDGKELSLAEVMREIEVSKIGVEVDNNAVNAAVQGKTYNQQIVIAQGTRPVNGLDGVISYRHECSGVLSPKKNERDEMDYKDLGLVKNVLAGTVIAEITPATEGEDGVDVCGVAHKAMPGKPPKYMIGKGTALNESETSIISEIDGNLRWHRDHFTVDEVIVVAGDVGVETGNIDFIGDVQVKGNVFEGFTVSSKKNVVIAGTANNATIIADGNVDIKMGAVNSKITAKGNVKVGFCESSNIECEGDLTSASFVACEIFCNGTAYATSGKGIIIGGKMTCLKGMIFNQVGSDSYTKTRLTLGNGAILAEEKLELEKEEAKITDQINSLVQLIDGLNAVKKKKGELPRHHEDRLASSIRSRFKLSNEIKQIKKRIVQIEESFLDNVNLHIEVRKSIYPGITIRIGEMRKKVENKHDRCRIAIDNSGEIAIKPITGSI